MDFRDFVFLPQTSAFETLKSNGVDLVSNDSLRIDILRLFDFDYSAIEHLESSYEPAQFVSDYRYIVDYYFDQLELNFDSIDLSIVRLKHSDRVGYQRV